jgi:hypothetical protein
VTPREAVEGLRQAVAERAKARRGELSTIAVPFHVAVKIVQAFDQADIALEKAIHHDEDE